MFTTDTLSKKTILVTGGASGLGLAMAKQFIDCGARVGICGRDSDKLSKAESDLCADTDKVKGFVCDVRDYAAVGEMLKKVTQHFGALDALVNNAAGNFLCASEDISPNAFKTVVDIVLNGTFNCTQQFGKQLIDSKKSGVILNIVTTYTESGSSFVLPSACAKAGVYAMTSSLAFEWASYGIRLNSIAPGPFPTKGAWSRLVPDKKLEEEFMNRVPLGRFGKPEELADLATFLISDHASFITGECVTIDGGERLSAGQFNFLAQHVPREKLKELFKSMRAS